MKTPCTRRTFLKAATAATASLGGASFLRARPAYRVHLGFTCQTSNSRLVRRCEIWALFPLGNLFAYPHSTTNGTPATCTSRASAANKFHNLVYGPPSKFGYKDFIPMFRGEKFNAEEWALLFRKAGAKFAGSVTEHADGFSLWDSKVNEWNAARMGPCRDVAGELSRAVRAEGLKFLATFHHQWLWGWYPTADKTVDAGDPKYSGLYGPNAPGTPFNYHGYRTHPTASSARPLFRMFGKPK